MISLSNIGFLILQVAFGLTVNVAAEPNSCTSIDFNEKIDWNSKAPNFDNVQPFQTPGVLVSGQPNITFSKILNFTGLLWNAGNFQELSGLVCSHYGPYIYAQTGEENVKTECNKIVTSLAQNKRSDVYEECIEIFSSLEVPDASSFIFDESACRTGNNSSPFVFNITDVECELQKLMASHVTDTIELVSRLTFTTLNWLGASPFSGDVFGACSGMRLLAGMETDDVSYQLKLIASHVVADLLRRFDRYDGCHDTDETFLLMVNQLLLPDQSEGDLCELLERSPSDEHYQRLSEDIVDTLQSTLVDSDRCSNTLILLNGLAGANSLAITDIVTFVVGVNISNGEDRHGFCTDLAKSLSNTTTYSPSPYISNRINSSWQPFQEQGELLPDFTIMDAVDVLGAVSRSDTLADGATVLCAVFGPFTSQLSQGGNVSRLCQALQESDLAAFEQICREISVPIQYPPGHPPSLRVPTRSYLIVTGVDMLRRLLKLEAVTPEQGCTALDDFIHDPANTPQNVVRFILDSYLSELLPIARDFCADYDVIMSYLRASSNLSEETFSVFTEKISALIFTYFGFDNRNDMCTKISEGILDVSGRASDGLTSYFVEEAVGFVTDIEKCIDTIEAGKATLADALGEQIDVSTLINTVTGYKTTADLCKAASSSFEGDGCDKSGAHPIRYHQLVLLALEIYLLLAALFS